MLEKNKKHYGSLGFKSDSYFQKLRVSFVCGFSNEDCVCWCMECTGLRVVYVRYSFFVGVRARGVRGSFAMCTNGDYMGLCHAMTAVTYFLRQKRFDGIDL